MMNLKKYINRFNENKSKNIMVIIFLIVISVFFTLYKLRLEDLVNVLSFNKIEEVGNDFKYAYKVTNADNNIRQTFEYESVEKLRAISIFLLKNDSKKGSLEVTLTADNVILYHNIIPVENLVDKENKFILDEEKFIKTGTELNLNIQPIDLDDAEELDIYCSDNTYEKGVMSVNGSDMFKDLSAIIYSSETHSILWFYVLFSILAAIGVTGLYYLLIVRKTKIENIYLYCAFLAGSMMLYIMPPGTVPDETTSFYYSAQYSSQILGKSDAENFSIREIEDTFPFNHQMSKANYVTLDRHFMELDTKNNWKESKLRTSFADIVSYIPSTIGITIARILHLGIVPTLYFGRIFSMLFAIGISYLAIKKIPFGKMLLFTIALLPMVMQEMVGITRDGFLNSMAFLSIAYALYLIFEKENISKREIFIIALINSLVILSKSGTYCALAFLPFLIDKDKVGGKKNYLKMFVFLLCMIVFTMIIYKWDLILQILTNSKDFVSEANTGPAPYSIAHFISYPKDFIYIIYNTISVNFNFYKDSLIGVNHFGWLNVNLLDIFAYGISILLILSIFKTENEKYDLSIKHRLGFIFIIILTILLVCTGFLLTWTAEGDTVISGLQGRYFVPILFLIYICFRNKTLVYKKDLNYMLIISLFIVQIGVLLNLLYMGIV